MGVEGPIALAVAAPRINIQGVAYCLVYLAYTHIVPSNTTSGEGCVPLQLQARQRATNRGVPSELQDAGSEEHGGATRRGPFHVCHYQGYLVMVAIFVGGALRGSEERMALYRREERNR